MKRLLLILILLCSFSLVHAKHITGGEMIYDLVSSTGTTKTYRITLILFRDENCFNCADMPPNVLIGIYNNDNNEPYGGAGTLPTIQVNLGRVESLPLTSVPQCITNPPSLSYTAGYYTFVVTLTNNNSGYTAAYQTCCRIESIRNIDNGVNGAGATYTTTIPGLNALGTTQIDNSPRFSKGISVVCFEKPFILDFSATDPDGDQLVYSLCNAYNGGAAQNAANITPSVPPYGSVGYVNGFTGISPLGPLASIDPQTGIISGIAPDVGKYVVSVCISSFRNGNFIAVHRKDFIITVAPCDFAAAELQPEYITCDGFSYQFSNLNQSPLNLTFYWDFGDPASGAENIKTDESPTHVFTDTGIFTIKFVVNRGTSCADSTTTKIKVYPGFFPAFDDNSPMCKDIPVQFRDRTTATYGTPDAWFWDFGNTATLSDTSRIKNPTYTYTQSGTYTTTLIVSSSKGCIDTIPGTVTIVDKPSLTVTNDTLICSIDNLQLNAAASAAGTVTWSPNYNINNINSYTPLVSPNVDTTYYVTYRDNFGCTNRDSVKVRVVDSVTLKTGRDTTICRTDGVTLSLTSNALKYVWTPAATLDDAGIKNPLATPAALFTTYYVRGNVGSCFDRDSITIKTVPYPLAKAGADTSVCFGTSAFLYASGGSSYTWSPVSFLDNPNSINPTSVNPEAGQINYIVTVRDTLGCPKPVNDTMQLTVIQVIADAGPRDTAVVSNQPLLLFATGGTRYLWGPDTRWLSNANINNPVSRPLDDIEYVVKVSNSIGCFDTDTIQVKFYTVLPGFFVPGAFTPNGDGLNDVIKPLALGLKSIEAFRIYNRWGQLMFSTAQIGAGWNGKFAGKPQESGTYVWYAEGTDYANKKLQKKGNVVLVR